ncbi:MAG: glycosyltransferase family 39 protein [Alphaproteobacteria bacterium]|nr:glycosyltransferase family 39 protein [Alphaproteobacteria bacterium]
MAVGAQDEARLAVGLAAIGALLCVMLAAPVPVLDEESYLDMAAQASVLRPYDWWRAWQPWGAGNEGDAFVFAHPPGHLWWVELVTGAVPDELGVRAWKVAAAAPWALLLAVSVGTLATQVTRRPLFAVLAWLGAPVVVLGLQRGLMPDLAVSACMAAAVLGWRAATAGSRRGAVLGGLALAAAAWVKYPALVLVPALAVHALVLARGERGVLLKRTLPFWLAAAAPWLLGEAWLWASYGRPHIVEVLSRAAEIDRGDMRGRVLGLLGRAFVLGLPAVVLLADLRKVLLLAPVLVVGALVLAWGPTDLDAATATRLMPFLLVGGVVVGLLWVVARSPARDRGPGRPGDTLLLVLWASAVLIGVVVGHNYVAPRYLLPAAAPVALVLARAVDARPRGRALLVVGALLGMAVGGGLTVAEHRYFQASADLAGEIARTWPTPGVATGEWSFRWRLREAGWGRLSAETPSGVLLVAPVHASPGPVPPDSTPVADYALGRFPLRVVHAGDRIGLYAETLGVLPLGLSDSPLEEAKAWRIR